MQAALHWSKLDPWIETRNQVEACLATDNLRDLNKMLGNQLKFSDKGLVAKKGAGWARMNFLTAQRLAHGLGEWLIRNPERRVGTDGIQNSRMWYECLAN